MFIYIYYMRVCVLYSHLCCLIQSWRLMNSFCCCNFLGVHAESNFCLPFPMADAQAECIVNWIFHWLMLDISMPIIHQFILIHVDSVASLPHASIGRACHHLATFIRRVFPWHSLLAMGASRCILSRWSKHVNSKVFENMESSNMSEVSVQWF